MLSFVSWQGEGGPDEHMYVLYTAAPVLGVLRKKAGPGVRRLINGLGLLAALLAHNLRLPDG